MDRGGAWKQAALRSEEEEEVRLVPYEGAWPARFIAEKEILESAIGNSVTGGIHHVGSHRTHHLHLVPADSPRYKAELDFRDLLRSHQDIAMRYASLKEELAGGFRHDRDGYTRAKAAFHRARAE